MTFRRSLVSLALIFSGFNLSAQVVSDFVTNADGWTAPTALAPGINYFATGGNPNGYVSARTPGSVILGATTLWIPYYFEAPAKFEGNKSAYYGGNLRYDAAQSTTGAPVQYAQAVMTDISGVAIYYYPSPPIQPPTFGTWTNFDIKLSAAPGYWKTGDASTATAATQAQVQAIMTNLATLQIQGLYRNANVITYLDNITMYPPITVGTQPAPKVVCNGVTTTFTTAASNNPNISYHWQFLDPALGWIDITNTGGYSNATTATLSVNTTGNFGAGNYRCRISGTAVDDAITNAVSLTINALPAAPKTSGASSCTSAALTLTASGGSAGQYRWYTLSSGGGLIAGQTGATYTTPVLSTTTTYYAAINNGTCESVRTAVAGTINTPPPAPSVTDGVICTPGAATLSASGGTAGQYRWYTLPSGGGLIAGQTNATYTTPVLSTTTTFYVSIDDGNCESARVAVTATVGGPACTNTPPLFEATSASTTVGSTVSIDLLSLISDSDNNLVLSTLTITAQPASGAKATINSSNQLVVDYSGISFTGTETVSVRICDAFSACTVRQIAIEVVGSITIFNAVSPNKDGKNDVFFIEHIDLLTDTKKNHVSIFNRWGDLVWEGNDYNNSTVAFSGLSKNNSELPSGTYYYKIEFVGGKKMETGYIELKR
jgi:gliding motility-associated-like protein